MSIALSLARLWAVALKELIQMRRDRLTFGMIIGIPVIQLVLFGFAINADPKRLPTAILSGDSSEFSRSIIAAMANSGYFRIARIAATESEAHELLERGEVQFVLTIPPDFSRKLMRGERPAILLEADATDPAATSNALAAILQLGNAIARDLRAASKLSSLVLIPSRCASIVFTTRKGSPSTTSFRGCSA